MTIVKALKKLGKKLNTSGTEPSGNTISAVLASIESAFNITGAAGASVTAIEFTTESGAITGGTATQSDGTEVTITVTEAEAESEPAGT